MSLEVQQAGCRTWKLQGAAPCFLRKLSSLRRAKPISRLPATHSLCTWLLPTHLPHGGKCVPTHPRTQGEGWAGLYDMVQ